ncbi:fibroblast growth factor 10-like [Actinia tenebrosa]|uniref:Fibroblast growth factor n=1 Tax=Actinia tenebrosa TaxID=6105 RepID=A0A6P8IJD3_ACTTE|nr:fibroblast growth factor 10-like [Actinia tenebrosa]
MILFQLAVCVVLTLCLTSATLQASFSSNTTQCVKANNTSARKKLRLNREIFSIPKAASPTHTRVIRLYCRTGYLMAAYNRRLQGTTDIKNNQTWFELQSYGQSIVRLKSLGTGKYLAINWQGKPKMQGRLREESLFRTKLERNGFHSFASHKYYLRHRHDLFIGIKKNGSVKTPLTTMPGQTAVQFIVLY